MTNNNLTDDAFLQLLEDTSDVDDNEEDQLSLSDADDITEVQYYDPLKLPHIPALESRQYPASSLDDDEPDLSPLFAGTNNQDVRWKKSRKPFVSPPFPDFPAEFNQPLPSIPGNPYEYFARYIDDSFYAEAAHYTNLYVEQTKEIHKNPFTPCSSSEIRVLFAQHIMMGVIKLPRVEKYFKKELGQSFFNKMSSKRFRALRTNLHLVNVEDRPTGQMLFKVQPLLDRIRRRLLQLPLEQNLCIDEQMIPFKGAFFAKQYVKDKPSPWGIKVFCLNGASGQPYDFLVYQGSKTPVDESILKEYGYGSAVVLKLAERIPIEARGHKLFFDNYFPSYKLFETLRVKNVRAAGTIRVNRFASPPLSDEKTLKAKGRGSASECVSSDGSVVVTRWYDDKLVNLASNFVGIGQRDRVERFDKAGNDRVTIERPEVVRLYNESMGGVDLMDRLLQYYRINIRTCKWPLRMIMHFIDFALVSAWMEYRGDCRGNGEKPMDLMDFRAAVATTLNRLEVIETSAESHEPPRNRGFFEEDLGEPVTKSECLPPPTRQIMPPKEVREDRVNHLARFADRKSEQRCMEEGCKKKTFVYCDKCRVFLCNKKNRECFYNYHNK